jgi:hypothetical protein
MEPTITQNSALYFAHHIASERRAELFRQVCTAARKRRPDVPRQLTFDNSFIGRRLHHDNGR